MECRSRSRLDRLRGRDRDRGAGGERGEQVLVVGVEGAARRASRSSATSTPRARPRKPSGTTSADVAPAATLSRPCPTRPRRSGIARARAARQRRLPASVPSSGSRRADEPRAHLAGRGRDAQLVALLEQHEERARLDERAPALDDQLQHAAPARSRSPTARAIAAVASRPRTARSSSARRRATSSYRRALSIATAAHSASTTTDSSSRSSNSCPAALSVR